MATTSTSLSANACARPAAGRARAQRGWSGARRAAQDQGAAAVAADAERGHRRVDMLGHRPAHRQLPLCRFGTTQRCRMQAARRRGPDGPCAGRAARLVGLDVGLPEVRVEAAAAGRRQRQQVVEEGPELLLAEACRAAGGPESARHALDRASPARGGGQWQGGCHGRPIGCAEGALYCLHYALLPPLRERLCSAACNGPNRAQVSERACPLRCRRSLHPAAATQCRPQASRRTVDGPEQCGTA